MPMYNGIDYSVPLLDFTQGVEKIQRLIDTFHPHEKALLVEFQSRGGEVVFTGMDPQHSASFAIRVDVTRHTPVIQLNANYSMPGRVVHEYTHYLQWLRGDLRYGFDARGELISLQWKDEPVIDFKSMDLRDYMDLPWEVEAHHVEAQWLDQEGLSWIPSWLRLKSRRTSLYLLGSLTALVGGGKSRAA